MIMEKEFKRIGNWYSLELEGNFYNVLIQREPDSIYCTPDSIIVFDRDFKLIMNEDLYENIEELMKKVDWKYDMIDEED